MSPFNFMSVSTRSIVCLTLYALAIVIKPLSLTVVAPLSAAAELDVRYAPERGHSSSGSDVRFAPTADSCTAAIHLSQLTHRQAKETMQESSTRASLLRFVSKNGSPSTSMAVTGCCLRAESAASSSAL